MPSCVMVDAENPRKALYKRFATICNMSERQLKSFAYMYENGYEYSAIVERFGMGYAEIPKLAEELGLKPRKPLRNTRDTKGFWK